ncbi:RNA polymerase subunit sigma-24 [Actinocatenispora thailandica]|uniref:RNA polymerase subunit sigma-24 n=1 Tax=Actinocatenispora thailandica TaxID=227318 RepID=A0A7R7DTH3_9ACTN|nr:SigE family RNA polymerase sigma factor [Actinocatenispora thailandica]BCJ37262.1 RNA polymerase subunit sigma-24 [Actinocatenispora thailandica]
MDAVAEREFLEFARTRTQVLLRSAYALTGQQQSAEDLVQSALAKTAAGWRRIDADPEPYARKVLYHEFVSWWRRRSTHEVPTPELPDQHAPDATGRSTTRLMLHAGLARLGRRQRAVLVLRYLEDRSTSEVAEILGCRPGTVASQTARALARLRVVAPELRELLDSEEAVR